MPVRPIPAPGDPVERYEYDPLSPVPADERRDYDLLFEEHLAGVVHMADPSRLYWPSSSHAPWSDVPKRQDAGDTHYWDVWHGRKPFTAYRTQFPRFMSEFGFQALPPYKTVQTYAAPEDQNMTSYIMEHHQRSGSGNGLMIGQMTDTFRMVIIGGIASHDLEALMEGDIDTQHEDMRKPAAVLSKIGDTMPGLGIVAAVLGIVITMQAIDGPAGEIGKKVAAALVGTFLGILLAYAVVEPLAPPLGGAGAHDRHRILQGVNALVRHDRHAYQRKTRRPAQHDLGHDPRVSAGSRRGHARRRGGDGGIQLELRFCE